MRFEQQIKQVWPVILPAVLPHIRTIDLIIICEYLMSVFNRRNAVQDSTDAINSDVTHAWVKSTTFLRCSDCYFFEVYTEFRASNP